MLVLPFVAVVLLALAMLCVVELSEVPRITGTVAFIVSCAAFYVALLR